MPDELSRAIQIDYSAKEKLLSGRRIFGPFVKINSPAVAEMLGLAGFDFAIIDCEHSFFSYAEVENMIRAAYSVGMSTIIRVPSAAEEHILHALDSGASGVQVPGLRTVNEVREAVACAKYYPEGKRGLSLAQRSVKFGFGDKSKYFTASNKATMMVIHIENKEMVEQIEEVCQVPGLDVLFLGPGDLSQSYGKPGELGAPEVIAAVEKSFAVAARYKKEVGIYVGNAADLERYTKMGARYLAWQSDVVLFGAALREACSLLSQHR
jgi:4-hydroxy-2-oxoheptanedioate aldolase